MVTRRRFRVVSRALDGKPRRRAVWTAGGGAVHYAVEFWSEAEYAQMDPSETSRAQFVPGVGYVSMDLVTDDEAEDIEQEQDAAREAWAAARGLEDCRW